MSIRELLAADPPRSAVALPAPATPGTVSTYHQDEWTVDWRRTLTAVLRIKWWVLLLAALGAGGGLLVGRLRPAVYGAQATIWIDGAAASNGGGVDRGPFRPARLLDTDAWLDLLRSYVVLDDVTRRERLFLSEPAPADSAIMAGFDVTDRYRPGDYRLTLSPGGYALSTGDGIPLDQGRLGDSVGRRLGFLWAPRNERGSRSITFTVLPLRDAARELSNRLDAKIDLNGSFLRIELRGSNPARLAAIVNAVAERYVAVAADLKREKLTELTKALETQLVAAQRTLADAESALEGFGVRTITLPSAADRGAATRAGEGAEAQDPLRQEFFQATVERDQVARDRAALSEALSQAGDSGIGSGALQGIGAVQQSAELSQALKELTDKEAERRALQYRYAEEYPPLQRLTQEIATLRGQTLPALVRALAQELATREERLRGRLASASRDLRQIPPRAIDEARLRRAVTIAENLYTTVEQRYQEARLAENSAVPDVRILDAASVPRAPVTDLSHRLLALGFCAGLGLALLGAVVLDRVDPRVRYPEQVSREMGLPILGTLPHLHRRWRGVDRKATEAALEALRGIRLNILREHGGASGALVFAVTSPGAGDGKSLLTSNLALSFAMAECPAVLVDADLRRGQLHRRLRVVRRPGLADFLRGDVDAEGILRETAIPGVSLIPSGLRTAAAPELLESPRLLDLLHGLRAQFPVVICDCPPLGAGVDAFLTGVAAGHVVVVLRTGVSHRLVAGNSLEMLRRLPVRVLGAVLNDVPALPAYRYYPYAPDYTVSEEEAAAAPRLLA
jgi:capsular exopolysaccharide synthesis family protein